MLNYDAPMYRPPSEARSLIFQVTLGCSFNECSFCDMYRSKEYSERSWEDVKSEITNNQAEYMAIISALKKFVDTDNDITIYSDSKNTVNQLNHEFAINNEKLRDLARESWLIIGKFSNLSIVWISRKENLAGKMLGS